MNGQRLDALAVREDKAAGKTYFTKIGAAFPIKSGDGYQIVLDAIPGSENGVYKILLKPPRPSGGGGSGIPF
jgi:hypothetical protein